MFETLKEWVGLLGDTFTVLMGIHWLIKILRDFHRNWKSRRALKKNKKG